MKIRLPGLMSIKQTEKSEELYTHKHRLFLIWCQTVIMSVWSDRIVESIYVSEQAFLSLVMLWYVNTEETQHEDKNSLKKRYESRNQMKRNAP